jgi:murein L,D-transpeptidase YcbB/YkuD
VFSLAAVCAAAIATARAQELGIVVEQSASATLHPAAEPDKQGTQTNVNPGSSDQRSLHPAQTSQEPAHAAPLQVDPIVALVRKRLAQGARGDEFDRADRDALKAHYAEPGRTPMWVAAGELSRRAKDVMAEIGRAEGWGLSSAAFELPNAKLARVSPAALAEAELKLGFAVLKYARHARGGRVDPMQTGQSGDHRPTLVAPKGVLSAIGNAEKPDVCLRGLHPKHPQFLRLRQALMKLGDSRPGLGSQPAPRFAESF